MEQDVLSRDIGIVYAGYKECQDWVAALSEADLRAFITRMDGKPPEDAVPEWYASRIAFEEFANRSVSARVIRTGRPGLFDRDPRALPVLEQVLNGVESITGGYAYEQNPEETQDIIWTSMALARHAHNAGATEDLWAYVHALDADNARHFETDADWFTGNELNDALLRAGIKDDGNRSGLRYVGVTTGFISEEEYEALVEREQGWRSSLDRAVIQYFRRFGDACGPFDKVRAKECYDACGSAFYFDRPVSALRSDAGTVPQTTDHPRAPVRPISATGSKETYEAFRRTEEKSGFSVYGYWFAPDGAVHAMKELQAHDRWIRLSSDGAPGIVGGRDDAWSLGWVSMTMADDKSMAANIAYRPDGPCAKALKAAARLVKRGGDFTTAVIEAYDDSHQSIRYEHHDDIKVASRRLNEIARDDVITVETTSLKKP